MARNIAFKALAMLGFLTSMRPAPLHPAPQRRKLASFAGVGVLPPDLVGVGVLPPDLVGVGVLPPDLVAARQALRNHVPYKSRNWWRARRVIQRYNLQGWAR